MDRRRLSFICGGESDWWFVGVNQADDSWVWIRLMIRGCELGFLDVKRLMICGGESGWWFMGWISLMIPWGWIRLMIHRCESGMDFWKVDLFCPKICPKMSYACDTVTTNFGAATRATTVSTLNGNNGWHCWQQENFVLILLLPYDVISVSRCCHFFKRLEFLHNVTRSI